MNVIKVSSVIFIFTFSVFIIIACSTDETPDESLAKVQIIQSSTTFTPDEQKLLTAVKDGSIFDLLGKSFDKESAIDVYNSNADNRGAPVNDSRDNERIASNLILNEFIVSQNFYNESQLSVPPLNIQSQIDNGFYAIIPRNPYTNEDIRSSLEYSPGDYFVASDKEAVIYIRHSGPDDPSYNSGLESFDKLEYIQYSEGDDESFYLTDGRSEYLFARYESPVDLNLDLLTKKYGAKYPLETARIYWIKQQMFKVMNLYFMEHDQVPKTLDVIIDYFGRKNPTAWINPYTGKPMTQTEKFGISKNNHGDLLDLDRPNDYTKASSEEYIQKYAGNFTYGTVIDYKNKEVALLTFYYINRDEKLESIYVATVVQSLPRK